MNGNKPRAELANLSRKRAEATPAAQAINQEMTRKMTDHIQRLSAAGTGGTKNAKHLRHRSISADVNRNVNNSTPVLSQHTGKRYDNKVTSLSSEMAA